MTYDGSISESKMFSTVPSINEKSFKNFGVPLIKYSEIDSNNDGKVDEISMKIQIKQNPSQI